MVDDDGPREFLVARNPEEGTSLPWLLWIPLGEGMALKARETWPRTGKVYCHPATWPADAEVVERVPVRSCRRRGAAVDLVLDRARLNRSQLVFTRARGRQMIFWQTAKVAKQARPNVTLPTARASGQVLTIIADTNETRGWRFGDQQAEVVRRKLPIGDYAVEDAAGRLVAAVERKSLEDLSAGLLDGRIRHQAAELATLPRAAIVVEARYSEVFRLTFVRPSVVAEAIAELGVRVPSVPVIFAENRTLAQEWSYRFLGAALAHVEEDRAAADVVEAMTGVAVEVAAGPGPTTEASAAEVRRWARSVGMAVADKGRVPAAVREAFEAARAAARE